jgi:hypothetical protein
LKLFDANQIYTKTIQMHIIKRYPTILPKLLIPKEIMQPERTTEVNISSFPQRGGELEVQCLFIIIGISVILI